MKKVVVIGTIKGRLANQLWNYASIYAFCLERRFECVNPSFFVYQKYFANIATTKFGHIFNVLPSRKICLLIYALYARLKKFFVKTKSLQADIDFFLPPSENGNEVQKNSLSKLEESDKLYLVGGLFRNPTGLEKYHEQIVEYFRPSAAIESKIDKIIFEARKKGDYLVGVHVRHGDYKVWQGGQYYISFEEARHRLESFLSTRPDIASQIVFVVCSDEAVDPEAFFGLNFISSKGSSIEDLYTLARCNMIIGSHSTFGPWAAYYGSVPFVQF